MNTITGVTPKRKRRKRINHIAVFLLTLSGVLLLGAAALFLLSYPRYAGKAGEEEAISYIESLPEDSGSIEVPGPEPEEAEDVLGAKVEPEPEYGEVTINFIGDILFDDEYAVTATMKQRGGMLSAGISQETLDYLSSTDLTVVNNEFPYTDRGTPTEGKQFTFRADPSTVSYLADMGADVAILANNHVFDYGQTGLLDTLDTLIDAGVRPLGAGKNLDEASAVAYYTVNNVTVALIAATQIERLDYPDTVGATENNGGTFRCWTGDLIYQKIAEAKENADFVIACIHWGTERETEPDYYQLKQAPLLAEAGADLIVGDHPHVLQGFAYFGDTPCLYSLGNFWFNSSPLDTGILTVTIGKDGLKSLRFLPARQESCRTRIVDGEEQSRILNEMRALSTGVSIDADGYVSAN